MEINERSLNQFRRDLEEALAPLEAKYAVDIKAGRISYELNEFRCSLNVRKKGLDDHIWEHNCGAYGFEQSDLGRRFRYKNDYYTIKGLNLKAKHPVQVVRVKDGVGYGFDRELIDLD